MFEETKSTKPNYVLTQISPGRCPDYPTERTGRCRKCNIRYIWPQKLGSLKTMKCPHCGDPLGQTTHLFKGTTVKISLPLTHVCRPGWCDVLKEVYVGQWAAELKAGKCPVCGGLLETGGTVKFVTKGEHAAMHEGKRR